MNDIKFTVCNFFTTFDTLEIITNTVVSREIINFLISFYIHQKLNSLMKNKETWENFSIKNEDIDIPANKGNS